MLHKLWRGVCPLMLLLCLWSGCHSAEGISSPSPATPQQTPSPQPTSTPTSVPAPTPTPDPAETAVQAALSVMSLQQKAAQLFMPELPSLHPEAFADGAQAGGYVLFAKDISTWDATRELTDSLTQASAIPPFIGIDEEGGVVSRLYSSGMADYARPDTAAAIGQTGDTATAYQAGVTIGEALHALGFNLDFAPVVDVLTEPTNTVIGSRAFGSDPVLVSDMAAAFTRGLHTHGILAVPKHFPGHGGTTGDSHDGYVSVPYDAARLEAVEYLPFARAIEEGAACIMVGHIAAPHADTSGLPASLSPYFVTEILRNELGFDGIVITDAMNMGAIAQNYTAAEAAVMAIQAGVDIVLMPADFEAALRGVIEAVQTGDLSETRLTESAARILRVKFEAGIWTN